MSLLRKLSCRCGPSLALLALLGCDARSGSGGGPPAEPVPPPLLIVGIDGATFDLILPLAREGRLPHLARLMDQGAWGRLQTMDPTLSPAIWTTVATGKAPEDHGIFGFDGVPGHTMTTLPTSDMRRVRAFWNILSEHGRSVGVVGWWVTWPAEPVLGYVVSDRVPYTRMEATLGPDLPRAHEVYPPELASVVRALVRRPEAITAAEVRRFLSLPDVEVERLIHSSAYAHGDFLPEFRHVYQSDRSTIDIALHLIRTRPTRVTAVGLYGVDTVSHLAWHFMQPEKFPAFDVSAEDVARFGELIPRYYEFVDGIVGELIDAMAEPADVIVFSDHGFGPTGRLPWSGGHGRITPGAPLAPDGVLIMAGPSIRSGVRLDRPHVLDLTPTLLYLQDLPLAADMPGGIFREALSEGLLERRPVRQVPTHETGPRQRPEGAPTADPGLDRAARRRLCALGYIECE